MVLSNHWSPYISWGKLEKTTDMVSDFPFYQSSETISYFIQGGLFFALWYHYGYNNGINHLVK